MSSYDNEPIQTIRIEERQRRRIIEEYYKRRQVNAGGKWPPRGVRVAYDNAEVSVSIANPGGNVISYTVIPRNISRKGIGFLHGRFVYPGSRCSVTLKTLDDESMTFDGVVVRCEHLGGTIHEVGAVFGSPIDLTLFTEMSAAELEQHKAEYENDVLNGSVVQAPSEAGKVLVVDESRLDRRLFVGLLEAERYSCREAEGTGQAMELIGSSAFDLVIVDLDPATGDGMELIDHLNGSAYKGSILATALDDETTVQEAALVAGAHKFVAKPINSLTFGKMVNVMLGVVGSGNQDTEPIVSTLNQDETYKPLLLDFISEIRALVSELRSPDRTADVPFLRGSCRKLVSAGAGYGFDDVTAVARKLIKLLEPSEPDPMVYKPSLNQLLNVLTRLRVE